MKNSQAAGSLWGRVLFAFLAGMLCTGRLFATTVIAPPFEELVNVSDYIVRATVKSVHSEYASPGSKMIVTYVELDVKEVITGNPPSPLVLRMLGGQIGDKRMVVEGAPQFVVGDEDILFIRNNGKSISPLTAMMHGRYPIIHDKTTGRAFVERNNHAPLKSTAEVSAPMEGRASAASSKATTATEAEALTPEQFAAAIRAAVNPNFQRKHEQ